nr:immunoglobulin light chain junction region [Macaca mulatta]
CQQYHSIPWSF